MPMEIDDTNNMEPQEILNKIEIGEFNHLENYEWNRLYGIIYDKYDGKGMFSMAIQIRAEIKIHSMLFQGEPPHLVHISEPGITINEDDITYYRTRALQTNNPILKSRYSDVVWQETLESEVDFAEIAIRAYLSCADIYFQLNKFNKLNTILYRAFYLANSINNQELMGECLEVHIKSIEKLITDNRIEYIYTILKSILNNYSEIISGTDISKLNNSINKCIDFYKNCRDFGWINKFGDLKKNFNI